VWTAPWQELSDAAAALVGYGHVSGQPNSLSHEWKKVVRRLKLPPIRFHDLRHSHATHMLACGVHVKVASERLGHSKVGITLDLYSHVLPGMQEDAVARVDAAFNAAKGR
jgi:integrase